MESSEKAHRSRNPDPGRWLSKHFPGQHATSPFFLFVCFVYFVVFSLSAWRLGSFSRSISQFRVLSAYQQETNAIAIWLRWTASCLASIVSLELSRQPGDPGDVPFTLPGDEPPGTIPA